MKSTVQDRLSTDHRHIAHLLAWLDRELELVAKTEPADIELLRNIMEYMTKYSDQVHHPLEDIMFRALREERPDTRQPIDRMMNEHEEIGRRGKALLDTLIQAVDGGLVERATLARIGEEYSQMQRAHLIYENEAVFPLADQFLADDTWRDVAERFAAQSDPVFGPVKDAAFADLLEHIQNMAS